MLDIKHLTTLKTIQKTNSLAEASRVLHLTLSAVSHQIKQLENHYQCTLFTRKTKPIRFTREGEIMLDLAQKILPAFRETELKLIANNEAVPDFFSMALECHSCYQWLIPTINNFRKHWPDVETDLSTEFNFDPLPKLCAGDLSIVITADPEQDMDLEYTPIFDFEMMAGVSVKNKLAKNTFLRPEDMTNETIIAYPVRQCKISIIKQFLTPAGITPWKIRHTELTLMAIELAASGQGICCLPNWAFAEYQDNTDIHIMRLGRKGLTQTLYVASRLQERNSALVEDFIQLSKLNSLKYLGDISLYD